MVEVAQNQVPVVGDILLLLDVPFLVYAWLHISPISLSEHLFLDEQKLVALTQPHHVCNWTRMRSRRPPSSRLWQLPACLPDDQLAGWRCYNTITTLLSFAAPHLLVTSGYRL